MYKIFIRPFILFLFFVLFNFISRIVFKETKIIELEFKKTCSFYLIITILHIMYCILYIPIVFHKVFV